MLHCVIQSTSLDFEWFLLGLLYSLLVTFLALSDSPWVKKVVNLSSKVRMIYSVISPLEHLSFDLSPADGGGGSGGGGASAPTLLPLLLLLPLLPLLLLPHCHMHEVSLQWYYWLHFVPSLCPSS